ncbi:Hsp20/alpha crystallin family protein [Rubritalea tangerina]|uniref:Hsp20/alpha crystallin family protein n=1 Tax=Rubritalea tangerina TaxID=430798 RepID=A0ABW4Z7L7_9BACT
MRTFTPFHNSSLLRDFNSFFEDVSRPQNHQLFSTSEGWAIRVDLPGFEKSELNLKVENKALELKAESKEGAPHKRQPVSHRFALGDEVDTQAIHAKLDQGVLEITLPKKETEALKTITIQ